MAVYEYLCPKCRNAFELMRPTSEEEKPAKCPKCGSEAQKLVPGFAAKTGDSTQPAGEPSRQPRVDSAVRRAPSPDSPGGAEPLPLSGHVGSGASAGRRDSAPQSLSQMLEELANRIRSLEREKRQAAATIQALEREKRQAAATIQGLEREVAALGFLIAQVSEKVDQMLREGLIDDESQPRSVNAPPTPTAGERPAESSADPQSDPKGRSGKAFRFD
jgi:putative FmdB family regulatory protein